MSSLLDEPGRVHLLRDAMRRRWLIVLSSTVLVGLAVVALALHSAPQYVSSASVFLQPIPGNALSPDATVNGQQVTVAMETEAGLVDSPEVVSRVARSTGIPSGDLVEHVSASVPTNTKIVQIQFQAGTPGAARRGAQAFAQAFLEFRQGLAEGALGRQEAKLSEQVAGADAKLQQIASGTGPAATAHRQILVGRMAALQASIGELQATDIHPGTISNPARQPNGAAGIKPLFLIVAGLFLGLGIGVFGAIAREATDDVVRDASLPGVRMPVLSELRGRELSRPLLLEPDSGESPRKAAVEAYRQLEVGVRARLTGDRAICISSAEPTGDVSADALNLAFLMARGGSRVTVVDASPNGSTLERLRDRIVGNAYAPQGARLDVGSPFPIVLNGVAEPAGYLTHVDEQRLLAVIQQHRGTSDHILVVGESLLTADGEVAALAADHTLLVVHRNRTRLRDIQHIEGRASALGVSFCGVFLVADRRGGRRRARDRSTSWRESPTAVKDDPVAGMASVWSLTGADHEG
ncbi:MAG TPA: hypothetical protein VI452_04950 [Marmoricola sp.]